MNLQAILTIAHLTFHEARRKRVTAAALLLGIAFVLLYTIGFLFVINEIRAEAIRAGTPAVFAVENVQVVGIIALAGLYAANFLGVMMSALLPVDTLSGEIRSGAIQTLLTKPAHRGDVLLGKWLGFWIILMIYMTLITGGVVLSTALIAQFTPPNAAAGIALMLLESSVVLTISIAGGTRLSTLANGVTVFGLYGLAFIGGWIERIGTMLGNRTAENIGVITSLLMPTEVLWQLAAFQMQPPLLRDLGLSPFSSASEPSALMVAWAGGFIMVLLLLALRWFGRRDL
jgi:ABC-type transport system involved in multi-copper enzyme maturation permease subunit